MDIIGILLMALSLSVDSLVVSMSGSVTLGKVGWRRVLAVALVFGAVQAFLLMAGWLIGASVASLVHKVAHFIGFAILLYIGGSMVWSAVRKGQEEKVDLTGLAHLFLAAVATSIDACAVGVSLAMSDVPSGDMWVLTAAVGLTTMAAASAGTSCGSIVGRRFGRPAKALGGLALVAIGVKLLCGAL
ncbi:MAG: manganese efflux pump [Bacteroidetes bacterium]|uniref:Putative manganese efflux pump MntP n=1 Tax=Candidatus Cryptobacteroides excrementipullorum TaxID=2840761 RepID=A0A9D9IUB4_9BACT|nr:manganese efflux pump [Candidatus Cryptobacteroides excrementipullorum]